MVPDPVEEGSIDTAAVSRSLPSAPDASAVIGGPLPVGTQVLTMDRNQQLRDTSIGVQYFPLTNADPCA